MITPTQSPSPAASGCNKFADALSVKDLMDAPASKDVIYEVSEAELKALVLALISAYSPMVRYVDDPEVMRRQARVETELKINLVLLAVYAVTKSWKGWPKHADGERTESVGEAAGDPPEASPPPAPAESL
jgi:hypothetical protein